MDTLWDLLTSCSAFCPAEFLPANLLPEVLSVNDRFYRIVKQLGEGGYAFVYLAKELNTAEAPLASQDAVAIKKIIAASGDSLAAAKKEIEVLKSLSHPNCCPLLNHATNLCSHHGSLAYNVLLVFPAYEEGTLFEELERRSAARRKLSSYQVLDIFRQICAGVGHMHSRGWAHMDIKPHNVLIRSPRQQQSNSKVPAAPGHQNMSVAQFEDDDADADGEAGTSLVSRGYEAVVMDFGSACKMPQVITSRTEALTLQEDAEAHCTATYRAPELFDVPSSCTIDTKVDVWSLGCSLFAMMYGSSPFQQALDQGSSLALAVINCRIPWPKNTAEQYPEELHSLVKLCLQVDPARRPSVPQLLERIHEAMAEPRVEAK